MNETYHKRPGAQRGVIFISMFTHHPALLHAERPGRLKRSPGEAVGVRVRAGPVSGDREGAASAGVLS